MNASIPFLLWLYQRITSLLKGVVRVYIWYRLKKGKEDSKRLTERFGVASQARPEGRIIWFHAASVGEAVSLLPLLQQIRDQFPHTIPLVTTGTVTAAIVMGKILPSGCIHQYSPVDVLEWVRSFLDHWQPDLAVFVESEFWPNMILECRARKIPLYLINAHLTLESFQAWQRFPSVIQHLLACFESFLVQSETVAARLIALGAQPSTVHVCGNLKFAAAPLTYDTLEFARLQAKMDGRPLWVAASTHAGEEDIMAETHRRLKSSLPTVLTVIIPRHPLRGGQITKDLWDKGLQVVQRSHQETVNPSTDIYVVDTLGELGLFYRLSEVAVLGGTFVPIGGHNPIEPVLLGCAVIWGPYTHKQRVICDVLEDAALAVTTPEALAPTIEKLLKDEEWRKEKIAQAQHLVAVQTHVLDRIMSQLGGNLSGINTEHNTPQTLRRVPQ